jgi:hypothetical protein
MTIPISGIHIPPVLIQAKHIYQSWHTSLVHVKRVDRYTIGTRIDDLFVAFLEQLFSASFAGDRFEKISLLSSVIGKCDLLKFLLQLAWEQKVIATPLYAQLLPELEEIGRMLGGWKRQVEQKTSLKK